MKNLSIILLLVFELLLSFSCRNNRLKTDEKELAKELLIDEREKGKSESLAKETQNSESGNGQISVFRKKEIRAIDPDRPPIRLDIPGIQGNTRNLKLSDVASSIRYVKLETPPDTILLYDHFYNNYDLMSAIMSDGENIIFQGLFGLTRFNMQGKYQETIWKNKTGIRFLGSGVIIGSEDLFGVNLANPASLTEGNLYYSFNNGPQGNSQVMKYKPGTNKNLTIQSQTEMPGQGKIQGDTVFNTKQSSEDRFSWIYGIGPDSWAGINQKWISGETGSLLVTFNDNGDTLCKFTDYDRIINFTGTLYRHTENMESYTYNGLLTIKQEYNDTVFRVIPPNRLLPAYIICFGENKVKYMDGLNPEIDLSGKYFLNSLFETNDFLLIRYTQNNDDSNNRKKGTVKFYNILFDKKQGKVYQEPGSSLLPEGILNDLDGGMPFWPDFITPQGEMMKLVSGKMLKDFVNSAGFKQATITDGNRQKQVSIASGLRATDMVIVIVK